MATQTHRPLQIKTSLGEDVLLVKSVRASERLGRPFCLRLELFGEQADLMSDDLLGKAVSVSYKPPGGQVQRHFHGIVTEFAQVDHARRFHQYRAVVRPWFWLLTRTSDCRIFQNLSVP